MKYKGVIMVGGIMLFGVILWFALTLNGVNKYFSFDKNIPRSNSNQKVYVANEGESVVSIIDTDTREIKTIDLSRQYYGKQLSYSAHNVQVGPKGIIVVVTANIAENQDEGHDVGAVNNDEVVLINPITDTIAGRIELDKGAHLAHVVINTYDTLAYVTSQDKNKIYIIDLVTKRLKETIQLPEGSLPHGMRLSPDDNYLYVALIGERGMAKVDTATGVFEIIPLSGKVIQVAVTPDGKYVFASLYDTKSIARYDTITNEIVNIPLPNGSKGPVQLYPTPDGAFIYVADQGYYFEQPISNLIYKINTTNLSVVSEMIGGQAPHGVVVSPDNEKTYITNLLSNTVTVILNKEDRVIDTLKVGKMPNGISIWTNGIGGTP